MTPTNLVMKNVEDVFKEEILLVIIVLIVLNTVMELTYTISFMDYLDNASTNLKLMMIIIMIKMKILIDHVTINAENVAKEEVMKIIIVINVLMVITLFTIKLVIVFLKMINQKTLISIILLVDLKDVMIDVKAVSKEEILLIITVIDVLMDITLFLIKLDIVSLLQKNQMIVI
jgi:hypothetical protein